MTSPKNEEANSKLRMLSTDLTPCLLLSEATDIVHEITVDILLLFFFK